MKVLPGTYPEHLEDSFQLIVAEEGNFQCAFALRVLQMDFRAQPFANPILQIRHVRIRRQRHYHTALGRPILAML